MKDHRVYTFDEVSPDRVQAVANLKGSRAVVVIYGSRGLYPTSDDLFGYLSQLGLDKDNCIILAGGAGGVDKTAELFAMSNGFRGYVFPAFWNTLGPSAGFSRNKEMAVAADYAIGVWDGESRGTQHMTRCLAHLPNSNKILVEKK